MSIKKTHMAWKVIDLKNKSMKLYHSIFYFIVGCPVECGETRSIFLSPGYLDLKSLSTKLTQSVA